MRLRLLTLLVLTLAACPAAAVDDEDTSAITERLLLEETLADNRFAIVPHRPTYILPLTYVDNPNEAPYEGTDVDLESLEAKYQISLKIPLAKGLLGGRERLYFGYTQLSLWQLYNRQTSASFRETVYEPEVLLTFLHNREVFGFRSRVLSIGLNHQSNGQSGLLSRSWNRIVAQLILERGDLYLSLRPWLRIPESEKKSPADPTGDDNPDIEKYMGNFEFRAVLRNGDAHWGLMLRNNLRDENRGAVELDYSRPLGNQVRAYVQYFNGYGESLIDYDHYNSRIGIGIMLTDWL
ncbi:MAG: phospholipase A [Thiohalomonadaceae bacterium]